LPAPARFDQRIAHGEEHRRGPRAIHRERSREERRRVGHGMGARQLQHRDLALRRGLLDARPPESQLEVGQHRSGTPGRAPDAGARTGDVVAPRDPSPSVTSIAGDGAGERRIGERVACAVTGR